MDDTRPSSRGTTANRSMQTFCVLALTAALAACNLSGGRTAPDAPASDGPGERPSGPLGKFDLAGIPCYRQPGETFARYERPLELEVHAGRPYVALLESVAGDYGVAVTIDHPVAGMQIGEQLAHYKAQR